MLLSFCKRVRKIEAFISRNLSTFLCNYQVPGEYPTINHHLQADGILSTEQASIINSLVHNLLSQRDGYTLVSLIRTSMRFTCVFYCQQLHSFALKSGMQSNVFVLTALISFYSKHQCLEQARQVFVEISEPNIVSWNALISGHMQNGFFQTALILFSKLEKTGMRPDMFSFTVAVTTCTHLSLLETGKTIQSKIIKYGYRANIIVGNCLIDMYGRCGLANDALKAFCEMEEKDVISWNSIISSTARNNRLKEALILLHQMPCPDTISYNQIIDGITRFWNMEDAIQVLFTMKDPSSSSWNSIISGYIERNRTEDALCFFKKMHRQKVHKDQFTFSTILKGVSGQSALRWGTLIHCCTIKTGFELFVTVGSALIDMYSKCGQIKMAETVFDLMSNKNLICWNALISGYVHNGDTKKVIELFDELKIVGLKPDHITLISILSACRRNKEYFHIGIQLFDSMVEEFGIKPTAEHCSCMIHLLSSSGNLSRAMRMIFELRFESCVMVWRSLLSACRDCGDDTVAEIAAEKMIELGEEDEFPYVLLSNIYASQEKWKNVNEIRELMRMRGLRKKAGFSWIETDNINLYANMPT